MGLGNTIEFAHRALGLVPEFLDAVNVILDVIMLVRELFRMVDPEVMKVRQVEHVAPSPAVCIDDAVRHDLARHDLCFAGLNRLFLMPTTMPPKRCYLGQPLTDLSP